LIGASKAIDNQGMTWINRYATLGPAFSAEVLPSPVPEPYWVAQNHALQADYALPDDWLNTHEALAVFSGNGLWDGMASRATVYSGHQFGHWAGQLGDGRALALGEFQTSRGCFEVQLKGAGKTPFSRMGDGRAVLRSSIREYLCSEAMAALGIPTTRALCLTGSPLPVLREELETAAVVTRIAPSFIRFGHFEHFANQSADSLALQKLADFVLEHYLNKLNHNLGNPYADLLLEVSLRTAKLMAQWQAVGFCHGVMNTDNMSILGLTLDYGPFQFMDGFNPHHICNHSDNQGRYAYDKQPQVAYWNLFCLGQALMPLIDDQELAMKAIEPYKAAYTAHWTHQFSMKLGLSESKPADAAVNMALIQDLLQIMAKEGTDFTLVWRRIGHAAKETQQSSNTWQSVKDLFIDQVAFGNWQARYMSQLQLQSDDGEVARMLAVNPKFVLRNHLVEVAIRKSKQGDHAEVDTLFKLLQSPFDEQPELEGYAQLPPAWAAEIEISCSS
jgi:uncharacterized protein YdiU (UPF0061 family)